MKKLLSLLLALVMVLSLVACGGDRVEKADKETENNEEKVYKDVHGDLAKEAEEKLPQYILEAIRAYYGIDFGGEITDKMVASVETLTIDIPAVTNGPYLVYIDAAVNGSDFTGIGIRPDGKVYPGRMESIRTQINDLYDKVMADPQTYKTLYNSLYVVTEEWFNTNYEKFLAYSELYDIEAPGLTEEQKNDILEVFPEITETGPFYVYESYMSTREVSHLLKFYSTMLMAKNTTTTLYGKIDLSYLKVLPNLKSVKCDERFDAKNCPVKLEVLEAPVLYGHYKCGDNLTWSFDGDTLKIKGTGDMWDFTDRCTPWWCDMRTVVIENGVTSIGASVFDGWAVQNVTIPDSVTKISDSAFNEDHLKEITFNGTKAEWEALFDGEALYKDRVICSDGLF